MKVKVKLSTDLVQLILVIFLKIKKLCKHLEKIGDCKIKTFDVFIVRTCPCFVDCVPVLWKVIPTEKMFLLFVSMNMILLMKIQIIRFWPKHLVAVRQFYLVVKSTCWTWSCLMHIGVDITIQLLTLLQGSVITGFI